MTKAHVQWAAYSLKLQLDVGFSLTMGPALHSGITQNRNKTYVQLCQNTQKREDSIHAVT